jgi:valyl-tRNA synthetase
LQITIPLPQELACAEKGRLEKEQQKLIKNIEGLRNLLSNPDFHAKATPEVVEKQKNALATAEKELISIAAKLAE